MIYPSLVILGSLGLILAGSSLFTNGIEWFGKRFNLSHGATGSVLSGVGTALPETVVPLIAILSGKSPSEADIGVGAILGAPFMLATLTLPLTGFGVYFFSRIGKRSRQIHMNFEETAVDLKFFLVSFSGAVVSSLLRNGVIHYITALFLIGLYVFYLKVVFQRPSSEEMDLEPLIFQKRSENPGLTPIGSQVLVGLGIIILGAGYFIEGIVKFASFFQVSPLILSLLITPIATELPEKFNSMIWIRKKKDHLAISNVTGAMVFQSTFPVAIGLVGTPWTFDRNGYFNITLTLFASLYFYLVIFVRKRWEAYHLMLGSLPYLLFLLTLLIFR